MRASLARLGGRLAHPLPRLASTRPVPPLRGFAGGGVAYSTQQTLASGASRAASGGGGGGGGGSASPDAAPASTAALPADPSLPAEVVGRVMSAQANFVRVRVDGLVEEEGGGPAASAASSATPSPHLSALPTTDLLCIVRGLLKKMKQSVLVGDRVTVGAIDWADGRGAVTAVLARDRGAATLADPAVANVDQVVCVFALARPPFEPKTASKFLVAAEAATRAGAAGRVVVVLNKADLVSPAELADATAAVTGWGYEAVPTAVGPEAGGHKETDAELYATGGGAVSAPASAGLGRLREVLAGRLSVLAGPSGVGKSSLINALRAEAATMSVSDVDDAEEEEEEEAAPSTSAALAVGGVSRAGRGRHTTRHVSLIPLPGDPSGTGAVADTPGFNQPDLDRAGVEAAGLAALFPEVRDRLGSCAFADCAHAGEPGCALVGGLAGLGDAAAASTPPWPRHSWYLEWRADLEASAKLSISRSAGKAAREGSVRFKSGAGGAPVAEARLDPKKNRRISRRAGKKSLADLLAEEEI